MNVRIAHCALALSTAAILCCTGAIAGEGSRAHEDRTLAGDRPVIVNEGHPDDAFAATAGSGGFSDGHLARQARKRFVVLDHDGSEQLSRDEVPEETLLLARYEQYDLDDDGEISRNEFQSWFAATSQLGSAALSEADDDVAFDERD